MHLVHYNKLKYKHKIFLMHMQYHLVSVVLIILRILNPVLLFSPGATSCKSHFSVIHDTLFRLLSAKQKISRLKAFKAPQISTMFI